MSSNALTAKKGAASIDLAREFLLFNDASRSPFHATAAVADLLRDAGFTPIAEIDPWEGALKPGGSYFFTRESSSIVAFSVGSQYLPETAAFALIGAHTDSPCFKVKPVSKVTAHGFLQLGVECYGGGLWHTWFDRDLTVAGRVVVRNPDTGSLTFRLVSIAKPILRIPTLAIHLSRNVNTDGFAPNKETHTIPILATQLADAINNPVAANGSAPAKADLAEAPSGLASDRHPPLLLHVLAGELDVLPEHIVDLDLCLSDTQHAAIGGALDEFVFAPRLDNLASCFTATKALINSLGNEFAGDSAVDNTSVRVVALFDHEEIGSSSSHGADSPLIVDSMQRIVKALGGDYHLAVRRSVMVSADMAHAIHPNYASKHEANHRPKMGGGLVIKTNQNQRYATSGITGLLIREAARRAGNLPIQEFVVPNDKPCGSTIGPIISSNTGLRTVDVGQAQLSMHSVREMCSAVDFSYTEQVFRAFFSLFLVIDSELVGTEIVV